MKEGLRVQMHDGEADIDAALVGRLVAGQFPEWADLPVTGIRSTGTVNAIFRLGDGLCARLPRLREWQAGLEAERIWLTELAPALTLRIPEPVAQGSPGDGYPFAWAVYRWIDGSSYSDELIDDEQCSARDLAQFIRELRRFPAVPGAPEAGRKPLRELDAVTREAIDLAAGVIDTAAATAAWELALGAPPWAGAGVWVHADLLRPNLIVEGGRLQAVIDFGGAGVGDPAADVIAAWSVFGPVGRKVFRADLDDDDATWDRARGFALHQAAMIVPYYRESNPDFVTHAKRTIEQVISDPGS